MSCKRSLVRILARVQRNSLLLEKLCNFFTFSKYYFLPQKTTASQTHFGFNNIGSNMYHFCATAVWNPKISNETPCTSKKHKQQKCYNKPKKVWVNSIPFLHLWRNHFLTLKSTVQFLKITLFYDNIQLWPKDVKQ